MRILYLDIIGGMSGDMALAALLDAGLDSKALKRGLGCLPLKGYKIKITRAKRGHINALHFNVEVKDDVRERDFLSITNLIKRSGLSRPVKLGALAAFRSLAEAETRIHRVELKDLHLHELGRVDSIIDIVGFALAVELLKVEKIFVSNIRLANPAPVTLELLKKRRLEPFGANFETLTPTAAAILKTFTKEGAPWPFRATHIGYGAGTKDPSEFPNLFRAILADSEGTLTPSVSGTPHRPDPTVGRDWCGGKSDSIFVLETNLDDMNPQDYEYLMERLFKAHCRDVFMAPVIMKKSRPGALLTVLVDEDNLEGAISIIFDETPSFGVRYYPVQRRLLERKFQKINGVNLKIGLKNGAPIKASPEYEDLKKLARKKKVPLRKLREQFFGLAQNKFTGYS